MNETRRNLDPKKRLRIKYRKGLERCTCGGMVAYDGEITQTLPTGFGFVGSRFQIDSVRIKGFGGNCMDCGRPIFAVKSYQRKTRHPRLKVRRRTRLDMRRRARILR